MIKIINIDSDEKIRTNKRISQPIQIPITVIKNISPLPIGKCLNSNLFFEKKNSQDRTKKLLRV